MLLDEPRNKTYGQRSFSYDALHEWNKLPFYVRKVLVLILLKII